MHRPSAKPVELLHLGAILLAASLLAPVVSARDFVVAPKGSDSNAGSVAAPLLTISRAAALMKPGDTCYIRAGIYRETVRPARSGTAAGRIMFAAYPGESSIVSGADLVGPWARHGNHVYKTRMGWTLNTAERKAGTDQVFVDGVMMPEARWPNIEVNPATISRDELARAEAGSITAPGSAEGSTATSRYETKDLARFEPGFWKGAHIFFIPGALWCGVTGDVTESSRSSITFTYNWLADESFYRTRAKDFFYLWGTLAALDAPGEWFRDGEGILHLWLPESDEPKGHLIEAKRRELCFDLRGRSHVTLDGIGLFAGGIETDSSSTDVVLDGIDAKYVGHGLWYKGWWTLATQRCIALRGNGSAIRNSSVAYGAGHCVEIRGDDMEAANNVVTDAGYVTNGCNITTVGNNIVVSHNTISGTGNQTCLDLSHTASSRAVYNDISHSGRLILDEAAIWVARDTDGEGTEIAWNLIHDTHAHSDGEEYFGNAAVYLEGRVKNFVIHHNVMWNLDGSGICLPGVEGEFSGVRVYNNTCDNTFNALKESGMEFCNNVFSGWQFGRVPPVELTANVTFKTRHANTQYLPNPGFADLEHADFRLQRNSQLIDAGKKIPPFTDGFAGAAPDIGALESGKLPFMAGALVSQRHLAGLSVEYSGAPGSATTFVISGVPQGRALPREFKLKIGAGEAGGGVARRGDQWIVTRVPTARSSGAIKIFAQIGDGDPVRMEAPASRAKVRQVARPVVKRLEPMDGAVEEFDEMLTARVASALGEGHRITLYMKSLSVSAVISEMAEDHRLRVTARGTMLDMELKRLSYDERCRLAVEVARDGEPSDHSIVAFFALAAGDEQRAGDALARCPQFAELVKGFFVEVKAETP